ncbi:MetQ/NlpA family ABC transporter substrate-binding protein [Peptostreptococcus faecalis]|uniref:MetQ/NlpA family ABC transporter substrate-binding protein n=1 Tax=Peptostreptococcus faecalis TaxID=2045015 RepID=UPI000C7C9D5A|nr:MetQ/NlpA family ABC transporter substrate-binding protein [Peptostreptococcus faecalis]
MSLKKIFTGFTATLLVATALTGCNSGTGSSSDKKEIKVGGTAISQVTYEAIKPEYEKLGYTTEFVMFDSNPVVLEACNSGEVDIALGQHKKFVESFNESKGADLDMATPYGYYTGIGLYSEKYKSVDDIPNGSEIAIMNDPMNMGIALRILQDSGLIKLNDKIESPTVADIVENKKNLKIIEMEQAQTVTALKDMAGACIFFTHMSNAGKDPASYLARDKDMINFPMGVIVKKENAESKWTTDFAKLFKEESVKEKVDKKYPGVFEFYKSDDQVKE